MRPTTSTPTIPTLFKRPLAAVALVAAAALTAAPAVAQQNVLLGVDTNANRILQLDANTGAILNGSFIVDAGSTTTYDFQTPRAAIQVGNQVWVSDQSANINAIYRFDLNGGYLGKIGGNTVGGGGLSNVRGLRLIGDTVYAVNAGTTNGAPGPALVRIDMQGNILGSFSTLAAGSTIGASPWDVVPYNGQLLVSDGTSRALQLYNLDGTYSGAFSAAINNIPQQMAVRANGNVLMSANGSQPLNSFGLYELGPTGNVLTSWAGSPGLGVRGVAELGNGRYLISEAGGNNATRGLGTIDPAGAANNNNFSLIVGNYNGGWLSPATVSAVPEPAPLLLWAAGIGVLVAVRQQQRSRRAAVT